MQTFLVTTRNLARLLLAITALTCGALAIAASFSMSEDELAAAEKSDKRFDPADIKRMQALSYPVQFTLAFQGTAPSTDGHPESASRAQTMENVRAIHAAATGYNDLVHNQTDTQLMAVSIALSILDGFRPKQPSDKEILASSWLRVRQDSFYLVLLAKHDTTLSMDAQIERAFEQGRAMLGEMKIDCAPTQVRLAPKDGVRLAQGELIPAAKHTRSYVCGRDEEVDAATAQAERVQLATQRIGVSGAGYSTGVYATVDMSGLAAKAGLRRVLDASGVMAPGTYGRALYERVKGSMPQGWVAVFSEPSEAGSYKVTIGDSGRELSLDFNGAGAAQQVAAH
jgi:hypothetical protein